MKKHIPQTPAQRLAGRINPAKTYWATFNRFSVRLRGEAVLDIAQSGANDEAVAYWVDRAEFPKNLRNEVTATPDSIRAELKEYGAWDKEELADDAANRARIVWQAAWNIADDDAPDSSDPLIPSGEVGPFANIGI